MQSLYRRGVTMLRSKQHLLSIFVFRALFRIFCLFLAVLFLPTPHVLQTPVWHSN